MRELPILLSGPMVRAISDGLFHRVDAALRVETSLFDRPIVAGHEGFSRGFRGILA